MNEISALNKELIEIENKKSEVSNNIKFKLEEIYKHLDSTDFYDRFILIQSLAYFGNDDTVIYEPGEFIEKFKYKLTKVKCKKVILKDFIENNYIEKYVFLGKNHLVGSIEDVFILALSCEVDTLMLSFHWEHCPGTFIKNEEYKIIFNIPYSKLESVDSFNSELERILRENENSYNSFMESYNNALSKIEEERKIKEKERKIQLFEELKKELENE